VQAAAKAAAAGPEARCVAAAGNSVQVAVVDGSAALPVQVVQPEDGQVLAGPREQQSVSPTGVAAHGAQQPAGLPAGPVLPLAVLACDRPASRSPS